jgi:hypothetical protein
LRGYVEGWLARGELSGSVRGDGWFVSSGALREELKRRLNEE